MNNLKVIKNFEEYKALIKSTEDKFECHEDWEEFFGFELEWDHETGEILESFDDYKGTFRECPESFPAIVQCVVEKEQDFRTGDLFVRQLNWITLEEIHNELRGAVKSVGASEEDGSLEIFLGEESNIVRCPDCGKEAEIRLTDYLCTYCNESSCMSKNTDNPCSGEYVFCESCGYYELI